MHRYIFFLFQFSAACFTGAAIWQYESMRHHAITMLKKRRNELYRKFESTGASIFDCYKLIRVVFF